MCKNIYRKWIFPELFMTINIYLMTAQLSTCGNKKEAKVQMPLGSDVYQQTIT